MMSCDIMYPSIVKVDDNLWDYLLSLHEGSEERAVEEAYNLQVGSHPSHHALSVMESPIAGCSVTSQPPASRGSLQSRTGWGGEGGGGAAVDRGTVHAHGVMYPAPGQRRGRSEDSTCLQSCPSPHPQGVISEGGLHQALRDVFPCKPPTNVSQLTACAANTAQTSGGCVDYIKVLSPVGIVTTCLQSTGSEHMSLQDVSGRPSEVVLLLLKQQREETRAFVAQLQATLHSSR